MSKIIQIAASSEGTRFLALYEDGSVVEFYEESLTAKWLKGETIVEGKNR